MQRAIDAAADPRDRRAGRGTTVRAGAGTTTPDAVVRPRRARRGTAPPVRTGPRPAPPDGGPRWETGRTRGPSRPHEPSDARQATRRGRADVRRGGPPLRPHQHGAVVRAGPAVAAPHPPVPRARARAAGARPRRRHRGLDDRARPRRRRGRGLRLLPRACCAPGSPAAAPVPFVAGDATNLPFADGVFDAAVISFGLRNVSDVAPRPCARWPGSCGPADGSWCASSAGPTFAPFRVLYLNYLMRALPWVAAQGVVQQRGLRLPGRVDPGLAGPAGTRRDDRRQRLGLGALPQPDRRDRGPAPGRAAAPVSGPRGQGYRTDRNGPATGSAHRRRFT